MDLRIGKKLDFWVGIQKYVQRYKDVTYSPLYNVHCSCCYSLTCTCYRRLNTRTRVRVYRIKYARRKNSVEHDKRGAWVSKP